MVRTSIPVPASFEEAMALLGDVLAEKRRLELRVEALEKRLFGPRSEKLNLEDHQIPLLDEVFKNPVPAAAWAPAPGVGPCRIRTHRPGGPSCGG